MADMVRTSFWSRKARRKNCGKETLPGASSLHKCSTKQRCISKTMWESRSASARIWSLEPRANAVTVSVFKAIKLETRAKPVKPAGLQGATAWAAVGSKVDGWEAVTPGNASSLRVPDLNINNFTRAHRLADREPQQRVCLAQTKKRVRFLAANWHKFSTFRLPRTEFRRTLVFVRSPTQLAGSWSQSEIGPAILF